MIGKLKGTVEYIFDDNLFICVQNVCYIVYCSTKLLQNIQIENEITLFLHTMVRDDIQVLFGFAEYSEKELFVLLTSVQGVGGRMAMNLLSEIDYTDIVQAIQQENPKILQQVSGIGAKIALRIINELKSNKKFFTNYANSHKSDLNTQIKQDAISALLNLGFRRAEVISIVENHMKNFKYEKDLESILKFCISKLKT